MPTARKVRQADTVRSILDTDASPGSAISPSRTARRSAALS